MALSNLTSLMETNCYVDGGKGDFCDLPDKVIDKIFSYLEPKERMGMRLDKRLHKIEAESKYFIEKVKLKQSYREESKCVIIKDHEYPFDFIRRIVRNTSIGELDIEFPEPIEEALKFYNIIKESRCIRELRISDWSYKRAGIMTDSFFLDLSNRCEFLHLRNVTRNFSHENLQTLYKIVVDDSTCLRNFEIRVLNLETVKEFLNLLGISYSNGRIMSNRNIHAYKSYDHSRYRQHFVNIVDGFTRIVFIGCPNDWETTTNIEITFNKNQLAFNRFKYNTSLMERNGDFFDLLGFPDEVIDKFFSYLPAEERMRMRLNKRLNKIVDNSKYYMERVRLEQELKEFDFIRRIAHSTTIGDLTIFFPESIKVAREFCNIIREFRSIKTMWIYFPRRRIVDEIMTNSFFIDLSRKCEILNLSGININFYPISPEILHNVCKSMKDGSVSVRHVMLSGLLMEYIQEFLNFLGIAFRDDQVISNMNIEAYKEYYVDHAGTKTVNLFDGFIQIVFVVFPPANNHTARTINIELHKDQEALNSAKNRPPPEGFRRVRMNVYPE